MEEESKPYCHKFNRSQSNRLPVDCLKDSSGNLAATPAVSTGRLTEPGHRAPTYSVCLVFSLVGSSGDRTSRHMT